METMANVELFVLLNSVQGPKAQPHSLWRIEDHDNGEN